MAQKIYYEQMAELAAQSLYIQGPDTQDFGASPSVFLKTRLANCERRYMSSSNLSEAAIILGIPCISSTCSYSP